jgi:hypothetical protein
VGFAYSPNHKGEPPHRQLAKFRRHPQADQAAGFDNFRKRGTIQEAPSKRIEELLSWNVAGKLGTVTIPRLAPRRMTRPHLPSRCIRTSAHSPNTVRSSTDTWNQSAPWSSPQWVPDHCDVPRKEETLRQLTAGLNTVVASAAIDHGHIDEVHVLRS